MQVPRLGNRENSTDSNSNERGITKEKIVGKNLLTTLSLKQPARQVMTASAN